MKPFCIFLCFMRLSLFYSFAQDYYAGYGKDISKGDNLGIALKVKLVLMAAVFVVVAILMFSVLHK